jgi:hypothetical protein
MNRALSALERAGTCSSSTARSPCVVQSCPRVLARRPRSVATRVITPSRPSGQVASLESALKVKVSPQDLLQQTLAPVADDMETMRLNLKNVVGQRHPMLMAAAEQIFGAGGKRLRPAIVFLVSYATQQLVHNSR